MFKSLGLQTKDLNSALPSRPYAAGASSFTPTSPDASRTNNAKNSSRKPLDMEKMKARHNKKVLKTAASFDSLNSDWISPQPHLPSSVYNPNPFPLDPTQPGGVSRYNAFHAHREHETREVETIDIEIEETKGFVSGKSRESMDEALLDRAGGSGGDRNRVNDDGKDKDDEVVRKTNAMQKLNAGFKGALAKSGLAKSSKDKNTDRNTQMDNENAKVDAVLQHNLQLQRQQQRSQDREMAPRPVRGRERERQRTLSGPLYPDSMIRGEETTSSGSSGHKDRRDPFLDRQARLHSLSPPPPPGQERRNSASYWPAGHRQIHAEQTTPFIGYQSPPPTSPGRRAHQHQSQHSQQQRPFRPLSQTSDSDHAEYSRQGRDGGRCWSGERRESDRMRREALGGGPGGVRRQSGLNHVTNAADSVVRTSSEFGDDEDTSSASAATRQGRGTGTDQLPDRLSRAKEWVAATHSKSNTIATPAPVADRDGTLSSFPGGFPAKPNHRLSMDSEDYALIAPPRGSYLCSAGGGGYDARERIAMVNQMHMQGRQQRSYSRDSMTDDGRYWSRQLEGYERDRYGERRMEYDYDLQGGFHGYAPGGPDDADDEEEAESTLAPGSAAGGVGVGSSKKGLEESADAAKQANGVTPNQSAVAMADMEDTQLMSPKMPNKKRLILRLVSLFSSLLVLVLLIAASPVSKSSSPFTSQFGLAFHYVVAILSTLVSFAFVFNYFSRRLRRQEKMKRYVLFGLDIVMTLAWMIDIFVCISKFPCAVGGHNGWCDMYNSSVFLGIIAFMSFLAAFVWDIWGSFDHSKVFGNRPFIKPPPPGFDKRALSKQGAGPAGWGGANQVPQGMAPTRGVPPGAWPGQFPGQQFPGQGIPGQGFPMKPKNSKALW